MTGPDPLLSASPIPGFANLTLQADNQHNGDAVSPNAMLLDQPEEHIVEPNGTESEDVAIINPDSMETDVVLATDSMFEHTRPATCCPTPGSADPVIGDAMKEIVLPPLAEEPRILEDVVHTWEVQGWRTMNKKERGPIFQAGGYPW